jgi:hypothetical protein
MLITRQEARHDLGFNADSRAAGLILTMLAATRSAESLACAADDR